MPKPNLIPNSGSCVRSQQPNNQSDTKEALNDPSQKSEGGQNTLLLNDRHEIRGHAVAYYISQMRYRNFKSPEAYYVILGIHNLYFNQEGDEEEMLLIVHNSMRSPSFDRQRIIDEVNEVNLGEDDYRSPYGLYFEEHQDSRNKLIDELILYLEGKGRSFSGSDIAAWLAYAARRALLVELSDTSPRPSLSPCFADIDAGLSEHPFFKHLIEGPELTPEEAEEDLSPRNQLIWELMCGMKKIGFFYSYTDVSQWLNFYAERTLLIEVPQEPDHFLQPLFHPNFPFIDLGLSKHPYFGPLARYVM